MGAPQEIRGFEGNLLGVTNRNMARTQAMTLSHQADLTIFQARVLSVVDTQTPGAGQFFFYFLNGSNRSQVITRLEAFAATAETVLLQEVTGTATGGTEFPPKNRAAGNTRRPTQGVDIQTAANIGGLSTVGNPIERLNVPANGMDEKNLIDRPVVVEPGAAIALSGVTGAIAINFAVDFEAQVIEPAEVL